MENDPRETLLDLLSDWEISRNSGASPDASEICKDHLELLPRFQEEVKKLEKTNWMVDSGHSDQASQLQIKNEFGSGAVCSIDSSITPVELLNRMRRLNVFDVQEIAEINDSLSSKSSDEITKDLVAAGKLTKYQSKALLGVNHYPLVIDRYTIIDFIGSGGMGIVFKARHQKMDRVVALKTMPAFQQESAIRKERFRREINSLCQLKHSNIVGAIDALEWNEQLYLVMEFASGKDLNAIVRDHGPLPTESAMAVIFEIAKALDFAHKKGIIHRDVKPANILLADDGTVKLLDLGLAKIKSESESLTQSGGIVGTPNFLPPEHFDNLELTSAADIYSLGCTLYFLLTGSAPFESKQIINTIVAHKSHPIPRLPPQVRFSESVEPILNSLLAKSPSDRPASMASICESIKNSGLIDNQKLIQIDTLGTLPRQISAPVTSQPLSAITNSATNSPMGPFNNRRNIAFASLSIIAIGLLIAAFFLMRETKPESQNIKIAKWVLSYDGCSIEFETSVGLQTTSNLDTLPNEEFTITGIQLFAPTDPPDFLAFSKLTKLNWLSLSDFSEDEVRYVNLSKLSGLKKLYLENCDINDLAVNEIATLGKLHELHLPYCNFLGNVMENLRLNKLKSLTILDLDSTGIGKTEILAMNLPASLHEVDVSSNELNDNAVTVLANLPNLKRLVLYENPITDQSIQLIQELKNLETLDLSFTKVNGPVLSRLSNLKRLRELMVEGIGLDDDSISNLTVLSHLNTLDISDNPITDTGMGKLSVMKNLHTLYITGLKTVSEDAIDQLSEALPKCDFYE